MGKSLQELGLKDEKLPEQDLADLPEFGRFTPPPQPGSYRFKTPSDFSQLFDLVDSQKGQRIKIVFDQEHPLLIVQATNTQYLNEPFQTRLSNVERQRGKDGPEVSDLDYLLRAFGETSRPKSNKEYAQKLVGHAGKEFSADITYSWGCSDEREIYVKDAMGANQKVEGQMGCGRKYYQGKNVAKLADGTFPYEITCECGASIRAFANLDRIRA